MCYFIDSFLPISFTKYSDVDTIQKGMGEKLGAIVQSVAACIGCFTLAFFKSWQLTLVILSVSGGVLIPFTIISGKVCKCL